MTTKLSFLFFVLLSIFIKNNIYAQAPSPFTLTGQLRTRTEYRDGQGTLPLPGVTPSIFTSQRTRLSAGYTADRFKVLTTLQDVRVWGMDGSSISNLEGNKLFIHEAWGELIFNDSTWGDHKLSLKIGRQELLYDDARLLGNLDWLQQGRRHDAAVIKYAKNTFQLDAGFAFNQDREKKNAGNLYSGVPSPQPGIDTALNIAAPATSNFLGRQYKSMQYLYAAKDIGLSKVTFLLFKDDFQKSKSPVPPISAPNLQNNVNTVNKVTKGVNSRITTGINIFATILRKHKLDISAFYQGNKDPYGRDLNAYFFMVAPTFSIGRKYALTLGLDYLSGENTLDPGASKSTRFDPLYGTPHKFWGYMDYFYVADPYGVNPAPGAASNNQPNNYFSPGLINLYLKNKFKLRDNLTASIDLHEFWAANNVANTATADASDKLDARLGTELDVLLQWSMTKQIAIEGGYGLMVGTNTLDATKLPGVNKRNTGHWAYVMISIRPDFLFSKPAPPPALPDAIKTK